jgi:hypothetical protein
MGCSSYLQPLHRQSKSELISQGPFCTDCFRLPPLSQVCRSQVWRSQVWRSQVWRSQVWRSQVFDWLTLRTNTTMSLIPSRRMDRCGSTMVKPYGVGPAAIGWQSRPVQNVQRPGQPAPGGALVCASLSRNRGHGRLSARGSALPGSPPPIATRQSLHGILAPRESIRVRRK